MRPLSMACRCAILIGALGCFVSCRASSEAGLADNRAAEFAFVDGKAAEKQVDIYLHDGSIYVVPTAEIEGPYGSRGRLAIDPVEVVSLASPQNLAGMLEKALLASDRKARAPKGHASPMCRFIGGSDCSGLLKKPVCALTLDDSGYFLKLSVPASGAGPAFPGGVAYATAEEQSFGVGTPLSDIASAAIRMLAGR